MASILKVKDKDGSIVDIPVMRGDPGPQGEQGIQGEAGYTPVRGTDYWTAADIAEIKSYVDDAILGGAW